MAGILHKHASHLRKYTARNWPLAAVGGYISVSILLFMWSGIDIRIPCLIKLHTGISCLGCGMTRSFQAVISFDFAAAIAANPLIFVVLPASTCYIIQDYKRSYAEFESETALMKNFS